MAYINALNLVYLYIEIALKIMYDITIKEKQKTFTPDADPGERRKNMIKLSNVIAEILEDNGFSYDEVEEQDGKYYIELNNGTPEGEDWWVTVWFDGTDKSFVDAVEEITTNFDIDEEVEIWIPSRGQNGVPSSISALVHDAEWKLEQLESLLSDLQRRKILDSL